MLAENRAALESWTYTGTDLFSYPWDGEGRNTHLILPAPITFLGVAFAGWAADHSSTGTDPTLRFQYSTDSFDGLTGAWVNLRNWGSKFSINVNPSREQLRQDLLLPSAGPVSGVTALRLKMDGSVQNGGRLYNLIIFGYPDEGYDGLHFWDPEIDQALAYNAFDYDSINIDGVMPETAFRVHNSTDLPIYNVQVAAEQEPNTVSVNVEFSATNGDTWTPELTVPLVPANSESDQILARVSSDTEYLGLSTFKVKLTPASP